MLIKNLLLSSFRNFDKKKFVFSPITTIIIGPNASGKTSLLEAIFLLSVAKSFRAEREAEVVGFEEEVGRVKGLVMYEELATQEAQRSVLSEKFSAISVARELSATRLQAKEESTELEIVLTRGTVMDTKTPIKRFSVNGIGKRMIDFVGKLKVVLFWPEDLELVTDSPSLRRRYLDFVLSQTDREYRRSLGSYERGLRQRNRLLEAIRDENAHRHQLIFWDQLLIKNGEYITKKRGEYIEFINKLQSGVIPTKSEGRVEGSLANARFVSDKLRDSSTSLGMTRRQYQLLYDKSVISPTRLTQYAEEEIAAGVTLVGPHRDDFKFQIVNNAGELRDLSHYGSRGEQRLAILWMKLGELSFIENVTGDKPVLLLDDILSELDHEHRKIIFEFIGNQQTIMTTTDMHLVEKKIMKEVELIEL